MIKKAKYMKRAILEREYEALRAKIPILEQALKSERGKLFDTFKAAEILAIVGMLHVGQSEIPNSAPENELTRIAGQLGITPENVDELYARIAKASEAEPS